MDQLSIAQRLAVWALPILFAITIHEVAHGWVALQFGDRTAQMMGRLTLNPIKHIDPIGTILVPVLLLVLGGFVFGWAKPVPVNFNNLRNPRRDMALVALAGPVTNFIMALIWGALLKVATLVIKDYYQAGLWLGLMSQAGIMINLVLMVLNLIPIPPLDGSRVAESVMPPKTGYYFRMIEPYGFFILLGMIYFGILGKVLLPPVLGIRIFILQMFGLA